MFFDALLVQLPQDTKGNANLMLNVVDCVPKPYLVSRSHAFLDDIYAYVILWKNTISVFYYATAGQLLRFLFPWFLFYLYFSVYFYISGPLKTGIASYRYLVPEVNVLHVRINGRAREFTAVAYVARFLGKNHPKYGSNRVLSELGLSHHPPAIWLAYLVKQLSPVNQR